MSFLRKKIKYIIVFLREKNHIYYKIKQKKLKSINADTIRLGKKTYRIHPNAPTFYKKLKFFFFIDIDKNTPLTFAEIDSQLDPESFDILVNRKIISQLSSGLREPGTGIDLISIILGLIIGSLFGIMIMTFI